VTSRLLVASDTHRSEYREDCHCDLLGTDPVHLHLIYVIYLWFTGWLAWVRSPALVTEFLVLHSIQTGSGTHPMGTVWGRALSPRVKLPRRESDYSPPCIVEVKNGGAILPLSHTS
jgi:hypothetical protein